MVPLSVERYSQKLTRAHFKRMLTKRRARSSKRALNFLHRLREAEGGLPLNIERPNQLRVQVDLTNVKQREIQGEKIAIHEGQAARVNVGDSRYIGQVERVVSANGKLKSVEIAVPNYGYLTETEMTVRVEIDMDPSTVVTVPLSALVKSARASKLFVIESGKAAERMVTTGRRSPDWIEIKSGVRVGQSVIVNPAGLHSGQSVNATNQ